MLPAEDVAQVGDDVDQPAGGHAAEVAIALDKDGFSAVAGRGDGRADPARAAPHHHDIRLAADFYFTGRFGDRSCWHVKPPN